MYFKSRTSKTCYTLLLFLFKTNAELILFNFNPNVACLFSLYSHIYFDWQTPTNPKNLPFPSELKFKSMNFRESLIRKVYVTIMENAFARISSDSKKTNRKNASGKNRAITVRKMQFVKMENVLASGAIQDKLQIISVSDFVF